MKWRAGINVTNCNMQPGQTDVFPIAVHVRSALHNGTPCDGSLDGGGQLGEAGGPGYYHDPGTDQPSYQDTWGGPEDLIQMIKDVGAAWNINHSSQRIGVLDLSKSGGGPMVGHDCHENGLEADFRYVRNTGEGPLDLTAPNLPAYDRAKTIELLQLFVASGWVDLIYVHPNANISPTDVPGVVVDNSPTHQNHFHVRIVDPDGPDSNSCWLSWRDPNE